MGSKEVIDGSGDFFRVEEMGWSKHSRGSRRKSRASVETGMRLEGEGLDHQNWWQGKVWQVESSESKQHQD